MADIFLSYAREDRERVRVLLAALRSRWEVWSDHDLAAGPRWDEEIERQLDSARCIVVVWSTESVRNENVLDEATEGLERNALVPVLFDRVKPPLGFRRRQTADLVGWSGSIEDPRFTTFADSIARVVPAGRHAEPKPPVRVVASQSLVPRDMETPTRTSGAVATSRQRRPHAHAGLAEVQDLLVAHASDPKARARAVDEYCQAHGDPRFRADAWFLPGDPLLGFVEIPAGPFTLGSDRKKDPRADAAEQPAHELTVPGFYSARFPVTVGQFRAYVEDAGVTPGEPDCLRGVANHPVVKVSWHEALAYAAWLTGKLREWPSTPRPLARVLDPKGKGVQPWRVTLASEAEWEKAARGADGRIYPWGLLQIRTRRTMTPPGSAGRARWDVSREGRARMGSRT